MCLNTLMRMRRIIMVDVSDFETWDDYVRYREINGYTEEELDCMYEMEQEEIYESDLN